MKKSIFMLCLTLVMVFCFSTSAFAQVVIYVNGVDVESGGYWLNADTSATGATGDASNYNFHYDVASSTLYLNNAVITNGNLALEGLETNSLSTGIYSDSALTVSVSGTNTVFSSDAKGTFGIYCNDALTVNTANDASLSLYCSDQAVYANGNASFTGGTITAYGGIATGNSGDLTLSGVDFSVEVGSFVAVSADSLIAIQTDGAVTVTNGANVSAIAGMVNAQDPATDLLSAGIVTGGGMTVDGNSTLKARSYGIYGSSSHALSCYGIYSSSTENGVTINSGSVMVNSVYPVNNGSDVTSNGIYSAKDLTVTGGEVNVSGYTSAVSVAGAFTSGTVNKAMYYWNSDYGVFSGTGTEVMGTAVTSSSTNLLLSQTNQTYYPVFANGVQFTAENAAAGIPCGGGKAYLDVPEGDGAYTMTLDHATITTGTDMDTIAFEYGLEYSFYYGYEKAYLDGIYSYGVDLDIDLIGDNSIVSDEEQPLAEGIYVEGGGLTIDGTGTLSDDVAIWSIGSDGQMVIKNCTITSSVSFTDSLAIYTNNDSMYIENADITVDSAGYGGISSEGDLYISDSQVTSSCRDGSAIQSYGALQVDRSDISATANDARGIYASGDIAFCNSIVTASATAGYGVYTGGALKMFYSDVETTVDPGFLAFYVGDATVTVTGMTIMAAKANGTDVAENDLSNVAFSTDNKTYRYNETDINNLQFVNDQTTGAYVDKDNWADWSKDYIYFVIHNGIMIGMDDDPLYFGTYETVNRGMMVQILYNLAGSPEITADDIATYNDQFTDVPGSAWYYDAVVWAANNGIAVGTGDGIFSPNAKVTREQMVTFFWRYSGSPDSTYSLSAFLDQDQISSYAQTAFSWAVENGMISGVANIGGDVTLSPRNSSTRQQIAAVVTRYCRNILTDQDWIDIGWML